MMLYAFIRTRLRLVLCSLLLLTACSATPTATPRSTKTSRPATAAPPTTVPPLTAAPAPTSIDALNDEFGDAASLKNWHDLAVEEDWPNWIDTIDINTSSAGQMYLVPKTSGWYENYRGVLLYKPVTGDFDVTTRIRATGKQSNLPTASFSLAGLMVRTPPGQSAATWKPGNENWVLITTGYGDSYLQRAGKHQIETTTTVDSSSVVDLRVGGDDWVELRVVRLNAHVLMFYRLSGQDWKLSQAYTRADFPATLQVGINAYSSNTVGEDPAVYNRRPTPPPGDLIARIDYIRFQRPVIANSYQASIAAGTMKSVDWVNAIGAAAQP